MSNAVTEAATAEIRTVAVLGAGVIGTSVAFACARAGHRVVLIDRPGKDWSMVRRDLRQHLRRGRLSASGAPTVDVDAIALSDDLAAIAHATIIVENVPESRETKDQVYRAIAALGIGDAVLFANTSSIRIAQLARVLPNPDRVIGVHFMNPVDRVATVEVIRGPKTSDETLTVALGFLTTLGKTGIVVGDSPGFVINRILMPMINSAAQLIAERVATAAEVDQLFKGCLGHAMGPCRTADLIGIDTVVDTLRVLAATLDDGTLAPADLLLDMVRDRHLGMKIGQGFYRYDPGSTHD